MSKCQQNSSFKMCVLSALTTTVQSRCLIAIGRAIHNRGPTTLNKRSPKLTSFVRGTANRCCCEERVRPQEHFSRVVSYRTRKCSLRWSFLLIRICMGSWNKFSLYAQAATLGNFLICINVRWPQIDIEVF